MSKLTGAKLEAKLAAEIEAKPPGRHGFGDGLWLDVGGRRRSWSFRYMVAGRARAMGLGSYPTVSMADARRKIEDARSLIAAGKDPIDQRRSAKAERTLEANRSVTFDQAAAAYIREHETGWRNPKHRAQWRSSLATYASPTIGKLPVADITTEHVLAVLRPIWKKKPETAVRVRGRVETVLASAIAQGWAKEPNVARWHNHLQMVLPARSKVAPVQPHPALPYSELPAFLAALRPREDFSSWAMQFAILTAARSGEVRGMVWTELDLDPALWVVPASRMKAHREHVVPLSEAALAVIEKAAAVRGKSEFVFPGMQPHRPLSDMSLLALLRRLGRDDITTHGFRATFKTWASDCTDYPREVIEAALAHTIGEQAEQSYQRGSWLPRRRALMDDWARFCGGQRTGAVVPLRVA